MSRSLMTERTVLLVRGRLQVIRGAVRRQHHASGHALQRMVFYDCPLDRDMLHRGSDEDSSR